MSLISVIDLGTGSIRNTVYNQSGKILDVKKRDNPILYPKPGWAEQDPHYWWTAVKETFRDFSPEIRNSISAISATSQREGIVPINEKFEPLSNIIIWLDGRTCAEGDEIVEKLGEQAIYDITGLVANPAWSLSKILWIKKHQQEIYANAFKFLQAEDYILSRLSGKAVTEFSIASRTCMLDVINRKWSDKVFNTFEIDRNKLPDLYEPGTCIGSLKADIAAELGLSADVQLYMGAGDQQAAAVGVGAIEEGMVSIGIGTSSALSMTLNKPVRALNHKIILNCAALPGKWEYEPPIWNTGGLVKWFFEQVQSSNRSYDEVLNDIQQIPAGCEGLIALPYFSGAGSPRWNPTIRGGFYGLGLHHNQSHLLRALMECIAFEIRFNIDSIRASGIQLKRVILSGGASQNRPLCQIIADVLQSEVSVFTEAEASSRGVFLLVRESMQSGNGIEKIPVTDNPEIIQLSPDPSKKEIYETVYNQFITLGNKLEELNF